MIFIDNFGQNIKSFSKQNSMLRIHSKSDRNWQELTVCILYVYILYYYYAYCPIIAVSSMDYIESQLIITLQGYKEIPGVAKIHRVIDSRSVWINVFAIVQCQNHFQLCSLFFMFGVFIRYTGNWGISNADRIRLKSNMS